MNIIISIKNNIAKNESNSEYICNNSDYVIHFLFDSEWEEFKAFLAEQYENGTPVTIEDTVGTSVEITLSTETSNLLESIETVKGTANIYFTNETVPTMTAKYRQDLQAFIIQHLGVNNG